MKAFAVLALMLCSALAGCGGGPVKRVSPPAASIQQLTVRADGSWSVDLRINNFSSVPMRFERVSLAMSVDGEQAGTLQGQPAVTIGPESADVTTIVLTPTSNARIMVADALAARRALPYELEGSVEAAPEDGRQRAFEVERSSALNPVPGLPGVLR